ncbi:MAG: SRPBCC family protein [Burkholderiales bacterium]
MGIKVENDFVIPAPIEDAWKVLIDIPRVVPCMPGSDVTEIIDDRRFRATARIKVGPVELQFRGEGEFFDVMPDTHSSKLRAKGSDAKGRGSFQTEMAFVLTAQDHETRAKVSTDITLSGSVAQYGRGAGLIKEITNQLTAQFAANLSALIAADHVVQRAASHAGNSVVRTRAEPAAKARDEPALASAAATGVESGHHRRSDMQSSAQPAAPVGSVREPAPPSAAAPLPARAQATTSAAAPISGLSLLFAAFKAMVRRWLGMKP